MHVFTYPLHAQNPIPNAQMPHPPVQSPQNNDVTYEWRGMQARVYDSKWKSDFLALSEAKLITPNSL